MNGLLLTALAAVLILLIRIIAAKNLPKPQLPLWARIVLLTVFLFGSLLTFYSTNQLVEKLKRNYWTVAEATVISSKVVETGSVRPQVSYSYEVEGVSYVDSSYLQAPGFGNRARQYDVAVKLSKQYEAGRKISIHYDPGNAGRSVILSTPSWDSYVRVGVGLTILMVSLFFGSLPRPGKTKTTSQLNSIRL